MYGLNPSLLGYVSELMESLKCVAREGGMGTVEDIVLAAYSPAVTMSMSG
jgi:hypothetical protein